MKLCVWRGALCSFNTMWAHLDKESTLALKFKKPTRSNSWFLTCVYNIYDKPCGQIRNMGREDKEIFHNVIEPSFLFFLFFFFFKSKGCIYGQLCNSESASGFWCPYQFKELLRLGILSRLISYLSSFF